MRRRRTVVILVGFAALVAILKLFVIDVVRVRENSMWPALDGSGDRVAVRRHGAAPQRWDLWLYELPQTDRTLIKRVLGLPNEYVDFQAGDVWVGDRRDNLKRVPLSESSEAPPWIPVYPPQLPGSDVSLRVTSSSGSVDPVDGGLRWTPEDEGLLAFVCGERRGIWDDYLGGEGKFRSGVHPVSDILIRLTVQDLDPGVEFKIRHRLSSPDEEHEFVVRVDRLGLRIGGQRRDLGGCELPLSIEMMTRDGRFTLRVGKVGSSLTTLVDQPRDTRLHWGFCSVEFAVSGGSATTSEVDVLRDVHYSWPPQRVDAGAYFVEDAYFLVGDNCPVSSDSRHHGPVAASELSGHVFQRVWPLSRWRSFP